MDTIRSRTDPKTMSLKASTPWFGGSEGSSMGLSLSGIAWSGVAIDAMGV